MAKDEESKDEAPPGAELPKKKVSGKKMVLFIIVGLLLVGGIVGALFFTGVIGGKAKDGEHAEASEHGEEAEEEEAPELDEHGKPVGPALYELPLSPINLQSENTKRPTFLKLKVTLELSKEADRAAVTTQAPRIIDSFQMYLRELTKEELQGSAGLERLREELRLRVNAALSPIKIKDVLFTDILFGQ